MKEYDTNLSGNTYRIVSSLPGLKDFEEVLKMKKEPPTLAQLQQDTTREQQRLAAGRQKIQDVKDLKAMQLLQHIDAEQIERDLETSVAAANVDPDAVDKSEKRLLDLQLAIDAVEGALEWPALVAEAEQEVQFMRDTVQEYGKSADKQQATTLERATQQAMQTRDANLLRRKITDVGRLRMRVLQDQPGFWVGLLRHLEEHRSSMRDQAQAEQWIGQANRAIHNNDARGLEAAVRQLYSLLPRDQQQRLDKGYRSTVGL
jgi:molecular chaperone DnaK